MPTVTKTIGSGARDFATIDAWDAAVPANLVTDGNSYVGQLFNDSEFVQSAASTTFASLSAHTTDASHTMTLTTGAGQSFQDAAGVRTNALAYNVSNGVGIRLTSAANYGDVILLNGVILFLTISKIQIQRQNTGGGVQCIRDISGCDDALYKDMIIEVAGSNGHVVQFRGNSTFVVNVLVIVRSSSNVDSCFNGNGFNPTLIGCGAVRSTTFTAGGTGFRRSYGTPILQSCYSFGFTTASTTGFDATNSKNNATDQTSIAGGSAQVSVTYSAATPFTSAADSTRDLRAIASTSLAANGFKDATNAPNDISGTARAASPTIGPWEIASVAAVQPTLTMVGAGKE